jgi:predicted nucleic acid-binding Zn ribbon protein
VRRRAPRPLSEALGPLQDAWRPHTLLADVQRAWPTAVGERIAREASPTAERGGVVTVTCSAATWAHELDLLGPTLVERVNAALGAPRVTRLKTTARRV